MPLQHQRLDGDDNQWFDHDLHNPQPHQWYGIYSAGNLNVDGPQRQPNVRPGHGHTDSNAMTSQVIMGTAA